ncbi:MULTISPECIES: DUF1552 domain-containing protein [Sorangium]|uniref:Secreted protein n=1 Tax=Sorangium cellulosum TaxID=56 RepID=A0A4P2QIM3_SORCE|nr:MULTISPECIES: DUF1552 domain-containing protein [Sorangium]AUX29794.1 hypothetical protein SOCE836_018870 [Sorangium cellulosum]WCQ89183.1 hypothetical protein NQZ70_01870 [Sorangium sp. Soce836]
MKRLMTRRNLLRGAGVCLALPFLESLAPRRARAGEPGTPKRFVLCTFPNGAPHHWWETAPAFGKTLKGADFKLPRVLEHFAPVKSKMLMISRLGNYTWSKEQNPFIEPSHSRCAAALSTCVDADQLGRDAGQDLGEWVGNGVSVDQLIVQKAGPEQATRIPSLQTGLGVKPGFFDGRSYAYNQAVSWKSPREPLKRSVNPKAVFDALVSAGAAPAAPVPGQTDEQARIEAERRAATEKSVIDTVLADANSLMNRVGSDDRKIVQQYLDSLREIEKNVTRVQSTMTPGQGSLGCSPIREPGVVPEPPGQQEGLNENDSTEAGEYKHDDHANVMIDLIVMAIQCDVTRVVTHMLDDARSEFEYRCIPADVRAKVGLEYRQGSSLHYHSCQHGPGNLGSTNEGGRYAVVEESNLDFAAINCWLGQKTAQLAERLAAIPEGDGTVLDHCVMVYMSEMRTHDHDAYDLPIVLLGGDGVFLNDAHVAYDALGSDRQLRDLWFTIMNQYYGLGVASFGEDRRGEPNRLLEEILR